MNIGIIDYGAGNVRSVAKLLDRLGVKNIISKAHEDLVSCDGLILPGVGAFGAAMKKLGESNLDLWLRDQVLINRQPILGICLGMQLFASQSDESPDVSGLSFIRAKVCRLDPGKETDNIGRPYYIPHIGWNSINWKKEAFLFTGVPNDSDFYFANSYHVVCESDADIVGISNYGDSSFVTAINHKNIFGVQFHPEKSQKFGRQVVKNFLGSLGMNNKC